MMSLWDVLIGHTYEPLLCPECQGRLRCTMHDVDDRIEFVCPNGHIWIKKGAE